MRFINAIKNNKVLAANFSYLSLLQVFNLLLPLITYPYLIRILGNELYGLVIYAQAIISYFAIFINYGFNISATKEISLNRDNLFKVSEIAVSVLSIKLILLLFSLLLLLILILISPIFNQNKYLFILTMGICLNEAIFPIWYFQGKEQMKYITYINLISRVIFTALIFLLVNTPNDYLLVPILNTIGALITGFISMYLLFFKDKLKFKLPQLSTLLSYIKESTPFFFSRSTAIIVAKTNTVIIGSFLGYREVAFYDLAVKISELSKIPSNIINQTIYPRISITKDMAFVKRIIKYNLFLSLSIYLLILIFSDKIIILFGGLQMIPAKYIIILLNITTPLAGISYFLGNTMLVVNNYYREFNMSVVLEALLYLVLICCLLLFNFITLYTLTTVLVFCSIFEVTYRLHYVKKYKII